MSILKGIWRCESPSISAPLVEAIDVATAIELAARSTGTHEAEFKASCWKVEKLGYLPEEWDKIWKEQKP
jgi:hypothetical protein